MSTIDLYQVLRQIPNVTDDQAKQAATGALQQARLSKIEADIAELKVFVRIMLALQLLILGLLLVPLIP